MGFERKEAALVGTAALLVFSRVFGLSVVLPGFVDHARTLAGQTDILVGTAFGAYGLTLALMQLPLGWLSDHIGRKPILIVGTLLFVVGSAWAAVADGMVSMILARLLQGSGAVSSTAMAMVGESVPRERRTMAMAMIGIPAGLGFFIGLLAAGGLQPLLGVPGLFWLAAAMGLVAGLPVPFLRSAAQRMAPSKQATGGAVMTLAAAGFVLNFSLTTVLFFLSDRGLSSGSRLGIPLAIALVIMGGASRIIDKRGLTWQPIGIGLLVLAGGAALTLMVSGPWIVWAATFFAAHATMSAVLPSQVSRTAGPSGGRGHGIQNIVAYMGTFVAGPLAGYFLDRAWAPMAILGALAAIVAAVAFGRLVVDRRAAASEEA